MVGVLAMAAAAAPPPVKDYEIEVRSSFCQILSFLHLLEIVGWGWVEGDPWFAYGMAKEGHGPEPQLELCVGQLPTLFLRGVVNTDKHWDCEIFVGSLQIRIEEAIADSQSLKCWWNLKF